MADSFFPGPANCDCPHWGGTVLCFISLLKKMSCHRGRDRFHALGFISRYGNQGPLTMKTIPAVSYVLSMDSFCTHDRHNFKVMGGSILAH